MPAEEDMLDGAEEHGAHQVGIKIRTELAGLHAIPDDRQQVARGAPDELVGLRLQELAVMLQVEENQARIIGVVAVEIEIAVNQCSEAVLRALE